MATGALAVMLRRPVKFVADRLESFLSDIHAREHKAKIRLACTRSGEILAFDLDDLTRSAPIRSTRARAASRATRWSTSRAGRTGTSNTAPARASSSPTRT
jgi:CO/xanthine dehydrogenase Mo-binding subunit